MVNVESYVIMSLRRTFVHFIYQKTNQLKKAGSFHRGTITPLTNRTSMEATIKYASNFCLFNGGVVECFYHPTRKEIELK